MADKDFNGILGVLLIFGLASTLVIGVSLFMFVVVNDEVLYRLDEQAIDLDIPDFALDGITEIGEQYKTIPQGVDYFFAISLVAFTIGFLYLSYFSNPLDYFSLFSLSTYGLILFLFILSLYVQITDWVQNIFINILPSVYPAMEIFNWYLSNIGIYNLVLIVAGLVLNNINLDLFSFFNNKKKEELVNDEM